MLGCICNLDTDCTKSDYAKLLACDLGSGKILFLFFCGLCNILIVLCRLYPLDPAVDIAAGKRRRGETGCIYETV